MGEYAVGADKASVDTERGESIFGDGPDERTRSFAILSSQGPDLHIVTRLEHVQHDDAVCDDAQPHARQRTGDESASRTGSEEDGVALSDEVDSGACDMLFFRGAD